MSLAGFMDIFNSQVFANHSHTSQHACGQRGKENRGNTLKTPWYA